MGGVYLLTNLRLSGEPLGYVFAFANCGLFALYIVLGHRMARGGGPAGVERLAAAMLIALVAVSPIGVKSALRAFFEPKLLLAGIGVGICSSVIPYICDQFAMARLSKATFATLLSLLPATACVIGALVLRQDTLSLRNDRNWLRYRRCCFKTERVLSEAVGCIRNIAESANSSSRSDEELHSDKFDRKCYMP
jgi:threonine/homoserine efflux transporter RhtA